MTSDLGVERVVPTQFLFHCSCGATIETSEKRETCPDCGETIEVLECVPTPGGKKYKLRISKHRHGWNTEPPLWPMGCVTAARPMRNHHEGSDSDQLFPPLSTIRPHLQSPDYNQRYLRLGLLILLSPLWVPLLWIFLSRAFGPATVEQDQSNNQTIETPEPTDCGLFSGCHYEKRTVHVNDRRGGRAVIIWQRVND